MKTLILAIITAAALTGCGVPFTLVHNADGSTTIVPPTVIEIPARSSK